MRIYRTLSWRIEKNREAPPSSHDFLGLVRHHGLQQIVKHLPLKKSVVVLVVPRRRA